MKRLLSLSLCVTLLLSMLVTGSVASATTGVDFLRRGSLSCTGATAQLKNGDLTITASAADQEAALTVDPAVNLTSFPCWDGIVESDVPFDIVFYDKAYSKWIYASANFCFEFDHNNGASNPLPSGKHQEAFSITGAYTWNGGTLPSDAAIRSIIFILKAPGTLTVKRCAMTDGTAFSKEPPDTVYQINQSFIHAIPAETTVNAFCNNARLQFDTMKTSVVKTGSVSSDYIGTGDTITLHNGLSSHSLTAVVRGDFDGNGITSTSDVRRLLLYCLGNTFFDEAQTAAADIVTDGTINTKDVQSLLLSMLIPPELQFAQNKAVDSETFVGETKYATFLASASRDTLVAGLADDLVPQGLAQSHKTDLLYMSAYASNGSNSVILVYDAKGSLCAEYILYNASGSPCTSHLGGLAVTDTTLFISYDSNTSYRVAAIPLKDLVTKGSQKVYINTFYELPVATSFLSYYNGYLWAGNFYLPSAGYDLMRTLNFTTSANGEEYGCYIAGYNLNDLGDRRLAPANGQTYATPDVLMAAPQKVQGMVYDHNTNTVILSHSWGRKNDSSLALYTVNLNKAADTAININNTSVPCHILENSSGQIKALPMAEGITLSGDGNVRILFESGANKYSDGLHRTDYIWSYRY